MVQWFLKHSDSEEVSSLASARHQVGWLMFHSYFSVEQVRSSFSQNVRLLLIYISLEGRVINEFGWLSRSVTAVSLNSYADVEVHVYSCWNQVQGHMNKLKRELNAFEMEAVRLKSNAN